MAIVNENMEEFPKTMTEKETQLFLSAIQNSQHYLEFGAGGSTFYVLLHSKAKIISIESSIDWIKSLEEYPVIRTGQEENRLAFAYADIGPTGPWGVPVDRTCAHLFPLYSSGVFHQYDLSFVDTVLIDGRFRVACALASIYYCHKNTQFLIHDFTVRPEYHILLRYLDVIQQEDTLVLCKAKETFVLNELLNDYEHYMLLPDDILDMPVTYSTLVKQLGCVSK